MYVARSSFEQTASITQVYGVIDVDVLKKFMQCAASINMGGS